MKRFFRLLTVACLMCGLVSACKQGIAVDQKKASSGKTLEILVAADADITNSATRALIDSLFASPQEGLNRVEPMFDLVYMPVSSFQNTEMFHVHRNVIQCEVKPGGEDKVYRYTDKFSAPQVIFDFVASSHASLDSLIAVFAPIIKEAIYGAEHRRVERAYGTIPGYDVMEHVQKQLGISVALSNEYTIAKSTNDLVWVRREHKKYSLNVLITKQPYINENQFSEEMVLNRIDTLFKYNVPGPSEGSYIGTERRLDFYRKQVSVQGQYAIEERGIWRTFGNYMGGPFVACVILSPDKRDVITAIGFIYSPIVNQRDLLMQVESVCHSVRFEPQDA